MTYAVKKVEIEKIRNIIEKATAEIRVDLELFKTFDEHIGTGLIPDGRKYFQSIKYTDTSDFAPLPQDLIGGTNDLQKVVPMQIVPPSTSW